MSQGYTSTYILEANRLSSEQVLSGNNTNNALFTNKVNNGLRLNTGDVVSVNSAYISELGAEGSQIEITGKAIDTLNASTVLEYNVVSHVARETTSSTDPANYEINTNVVNNYFLNSRVSASKVVQFRDDSINLVMNPYKNTNGEFYMSLPYNFVTPDGDATNPTFWEGEQGTAGGYPILETLPSVVGDLHCGNITKMPQSMGFNHKDRKEYRVTVNGSLTNAVANDNSRYSIFQLAEVIHPYPLTSASFTHCQESALNAIPYDPASGSMSVSLSNTSYVLGTRAHHRSNEYYRDIATFEYKRVKNLVNASVNVGYNSTNDVASKLTEDFLRTENITQRIFRDVNVTTIAENQVNKTYKCASPETFSYENAKSWLNWTDGANMEHIYNYITAYETIGVKRPDLYEQGRKSFGVHGYTVATGFLINRDKNPEQLLETTIPWTEDNLKNISDLIDAQQRYPELFDGRNINVPDGDFVDGKGMSILNNQFFLHMNSSMDNDLTLGYDCQDVQATYIHSRINLPSASCARATEFSTVPCFFQFNTRTRGMNASAVSGSDFENAVYGFAVKRTNAITDDTFITLKVRNGIDIGEIVGYDSGYPAGLRLGWDWHFTAYGCPCIMLYNGYMGKTGIGYEGMGVSQYVDIANTDTPERNFPEVVPEVYLGSPDVSVAFSDETDRFEIRHLHQSEVIGNLHNAGYTAEKTYQLLNASTGAVDYVNPDIAVPVNPQAAQKCYKLNKQANKNNFTPCMSPYRTQENASFFTSYTDGTSGSHTAQQPFPYLNPNYVANTVFDSTCGNYIVSWGVTEKWWDQSLWGIMGFKYHQTTGQGNNQTRVINSVNWSNMDENTTNADVSNTDFDQMTRNMFNSPTFNITPVNAIRPRFQTPSGNASHTFFPDIVITQTNGQPLRAQNIPTRTLRPYYTIRSNIVGQAQYLGGGQSGIPLPVVAIVDKVSNSGDYFNIDSSSLEFTITQPCIITDITTSIHDPDGSFSTLSPNSAVLYKIRKQINADMNVVSTILQGEPTQKAKQAFEAELSNPIPTKKDINSVVSLMVQK